MRHRIKVPPGEMTCCGCGDTFPAGAYCWRRAGGRNGEDTGIRPPSVPTASYLLPEEMEA